MTISASFTAPGDAGCCPVRDYTQVIGSTDDRHSSPPSVGVIEDDRPWLGAYVTSDASEPDALAVVGTVDGTPASSLLHIGDRVVGVLGETLPSKQPNLTSPVFDLLALHKPGDSVTLVVKRAGKRLQLPVVLALLHDQLHLHGSRRRGRVAWRPVQHRRRRDRKSTRLNSSHW